MSLGDWLKSINTTKQNLMLDADGNLNDDLEKSYIPFIINRTLSYFPDTAFHVNRLNSIGGIVPNRMQYDYLRTVIPTRSRFAPWHKKKSSPQAECISTFFGCSASKAEYLVKVLGETLCKQIQDSFDSINKK